MRSRRRLRPLVLVTVATTAAWSGTALAQLSVPTLPPVSVPLPSLVSSPATIVPIPTVIPTAVPTLPVATALPTLPSVPTALPTSLPSLPVTIPTSLPSLPVTLPTDLPTGLPDLPVGAPSLPLPLPSLPITLPTALPALPSLPSLPMGVPLPALPGADGGVGLPSGAVRLPTVAGVSDVFLDLDADGLADAQVARDGTVKAVSPARAAEIDRASGGAGTATARALAAKGGRRPAAPLRQVAVDGAPTGSGAERSTTVLLFAILLAVSVAASQLRAGRKAR